MRTITGIFFCLAILIGISPAGAAERRFPVVISVLAVESNRPVADAQLELLPTGNKGQKSAVQATSDATGTAHLQLPKGIYTVSVRHTGYGLAENSLVVNGQKPAGLTLYLNREAVISGQLLDGAGQPLVGAVMTAGARLSAVSGTDGRFSINGLDSHGYGLKIKLSGWVLEKELYVSVAAGEKKELGRVVARRGAVLRVTLNIDDTGARRTFDKVAAYLSGQSLFRHVVGDSRGAIVIPDLPPGRFTFSLSDERLTENRNEVELKEGEETKLTIECRVKPPTISIEEYSDLFLPDRPVKLRAYSLWVEKAEATVYSINEAPLLAGTADLSRPETITPQMLTRITSLSVPFKARNSSHTRNARISLPPLKPAAYLLELKGKGATARTLFLVTRLGLVAKSSAGGTLLYATDLLHGAALPGVTLIPLKAHRHSGAPDVTTGSDGLAQWDVKGSGQRLAGKLGASLAFLNLAPEQETGQITARTGYIYTDRPVYRPGQTVFFKGILRGKAGEGYTEPGIERVTVSVSDVGDKKICGLEKAVSPNGSFTGECAIPAAPALGGYTIAATAGNESWQGWFKVLEYRKPEFEVRMTPARRFQLGDEQAEVRVSGRYYFGAPVAGGKVSWRIYTRPDSGDDEDGGAQHRSGYSEFIGEGETALDGNGEALIRFTPKRMEMPYSCTVEADVSDISARQVSSGASLNVVPALVALRLNSAAYLARPKEPVEFSLHTAEWEGRAVAADVSLSFEREQYDKKSRTSSWVPDHTLKASTTADGSGHSRFAFPRSGFWRVRGVTADAAGRTSTAFAYVWVWNRGESWDGSYRELEADFDKKSYAPGETARLIVRSPASGGDLLLALEGRDILERRVVKLDGMVQVVEIPVRYEHAPTIHVSAVAVRDGRFYSRTLPLRVDLQPGRLAVTVSSDRPVYAPGETVRLALQSAIADKSAPAEFSLAVVDEAIFAISPEIREDIYTFFRGRREHLVTTVHSFPRVYLGGAAKDAGDMKQEQDDFKGLKVRKVFKDTALWLPILSTGADGQARAEFALPDNLTTWRATAVGHTARHEFGNGTGTFIARLDLMARLAPPRFFTSGDELKIPATVTSMTPVGQKVSGRFSTERLTLLGDARFEGFVEGNGVVRQEMRVRAGQAGSATLRFAVQGDARGDSLELAVPVLPRGIVRNVSSGLALREQSGELSLTLPETALPGTAQLKVAFSPTVADTLQSAIAQLAAFPYGCTEQTLSRFIPAVHAMRLLQKQAWQPDKSTADKLPAVTAEGLKRIAEFQHEDGGWGWWKDDPTSITMTAHALYGLALAKRAALELPDGMVARGLKALEDRMASAPVEQLPAAYRALVMNGGKNGPAEARIRKAGKALPVSGRLAFAGALVAAGRAQEAAQLIGELKTEVREEGSAAYLQDAESESWWYSWRWGGSTVENTASLLSLLAATRPADTLAPQLAEFLARRRSGGWWRTTTGSSAAVIALADYVTTTGEAEADYLSSLSLNGTELAVFAVRNGRLTTSPASLTITAEALKPGENRLKLTKTGSGAAYLSASLGYSVPPEAAASAPGMKLERSYYRVTSAKQGDVWRQEYTPLDRGESIAPGDDIEVRLALDTARALEYLIVEDRLPAGFEVRETDRDPRFAGMAGYRSWFSHSERRDDRMAYFITSLPSGRHEFRYVIHPELEGDIAAMPAGAWPMYQPELRGESTPWVMRVKKR